MSDLFQDGVEGDFIKRVWDTMEKAPQHVFQILTKRPENMLRIITSRQFHTLPNVWLGTSVESADYRSRISVLRKIPARVRFISFEPLLGSVGKVNLSGIHWAIVGGESGPRARPMKIEWVDKIESQCREYDTAFFFKQWGGTRKKNSGRVYRNRTWDEYPAATQSNAEMTL
jgi:protein gp37